MKRTIQKHTKKFLYSQKKVHEFSTNLQLTFSNFCYQVKILKILKKETDFSDRTLFIADKTHSKTPELSESETQRMQFFTRRRVSRGDEVTCQCAYVSRDISITKRGGMTSGSTRYVSVSLGEGDEPVELPVEEDGTLLLSVIQSQFEGSSGLKFR